MDASNRREFLRNAGVLAGVTAASRQLQAIAPSDAAHPSLEPWRPGWFDIHHINTGRGNSTLMLMPDGSSLLVDAGASGTQGPAMNPARPAESRRAGEWIARYVQRQLNSAGRSELDIALLTHLHGDHVGDPQAGSPKSKYGDYKLTGIADVAELIPVKRIIDRGFPDYEFPAKSNDPAAVNYVAFARSAASRGVVVERARVGSASQIASSRGGDRNSAFNFRILAGNGRVWTGEDEGSRSIFLSQDERKGNELATENSCSIALRVSYGAFCYFTGGDLTCDTNYGEDSWRDVESPAARVAGRVSVSTCNHHGYFDACGPEFVKALRPRVWLLQSWHASHPAMSTLANLYSPLLYPGERDVFCLGLHPAAAVTCARFSDRFMSKQGHVVVRVAPGGAEFTLLVVDDSDESSRVLASYGPFRS